MEEINTKLNEISNELDENKILEVTNKKLEETKKHLEKKLEEISKKLEENKILEETNKTLENKLEETSKNLEETNKKLEVTNKHLEKICNKDPVIISYNVSSSGIAVEKWYSHFMGEYYPTGKSVNGFPVFRKGEGYLYVLSKPNQGGGWNIGEKAGGEDVSLSQLFINPTPSTPTRNAWFFVDARRKWREDTSLTVRVTSHTVLSPYRVSSSKAEAPTYCLGNYHPTGYSKNGFPVFQSIDNNYCLLYVATEGNWRIGKDYKQGLIYQPDTDPTPSTPPLFGWKFSEIDNPNYDSSLSVIPITGKI